MPAPTHSWERSLPESGLPPLVVICGATATGKTGLSLALADRLGNVEIISADSRQVYGGMDIGTAKVSAADRARVRHHGLDLVEPDEPFSAGEFRRHALSALAGIAQRGHVALLVGGTGLYIRTVARNVPLEETPADPQLRATLESRLADEGLAALTADLARLAPTVAAATDLANPRRVVRGLERAILHGDRLPPAPTGYPGPSLWIGLRAGLKQHNSRITQRAAWQFGNGLLEEADELRKRYAPDQRAFSAFGYREAFAVLDGSLTREAALAQTVTRTRQFARRQATWFRSEPDVHWLDATSDYVSAAEALLRSSSIPT
jgi:tRNA dimethylallyltransferase